MLLFLPIDFHAAIYVFATPKALTGTAGGTSVDGAGAAVSPPATLGVSTASTKGTSVAASGTMGLGAGAGGAGPTSGASSVTNFKGRVSYIYDII